MEHSELNFGDIDGLEEGDIFFDDFMLSDFDNVESFLGDEGSSTTRSEGDSDQRTTKREPVKKTRVKKRKFEEISVDDIRQQYTDLTVKAIGLGDEKKIRNVFETHYSPDCIFVFRFTKDTPELPRLREIQGSKNMTNFVMSVIEICPDCIFNVIGRKLNVYKDGSSYLVAKLSVSGSLLHGTASQLFEPYDEVLAPIVSRSSASTTSANVSENQGAINSAFVPSFMRKSANKQQRKRIQIAISNVSHINVEGCIVKVDTYMKAEIMDALDSSDDDD
jgi:hypothetical protein